MKRLWLYLVSNHFPQTVWLQRARPEYAGGSWFFERLCITGVNYTLPRSFTDHNISLEAIGIWLFNLLIYWRKLVINSRLSFWSNVCARAQSWDFDSVLFRYQRHYIFTFTKKKICENKNQWLCLPLDTTGVLRSDWCLVRKEWELLCGVCTYHPWHVKIQLCSFILFLHLLASPAGSRLPLLPWLSHFAWLRSWPFGQRYNLLHHSYQG